MIKPPVRIIRRIRALFALANGTCSANEAAAARRVARGLMKRHRVSQQHLDDAHSGFVTVICATRARIPLEFRLAATVLTEQFHVRLQTRRQSSRLQNVYIHGRRHHVDIAAHVFWLLVRAFRGAWNEYRRIVAKRYQDRTSFMTGMYFGVSDALHEQATRPASVGPALAVRPGDRDALDQYCPPARQGSKRTLPALSAAVVEAGRCAGARVAIRRAIGRAS